MAISGGKLSLILTELSVEDREYLDIDHPMDGSVGRKESKWLGLLRMNFRR